MTAQEKTWPSAVDGFILTEEKKIHDGLFQSKLFYSRHKYLAGAYSVRDILWLRLFAVAASLIAIPYFLLQPATLWAPLSCFHVCLPLSDIYASISDIRDAMNRNSTEAVRKKIRARKPGWVFTPKAFNGLGSRAAVDQALSRLQRDGEIRRLAQGIYEFPRIHPRIGLLAPSPESVAEAVAERTHSRILVSGAKALNLLGLSTQVPAQNLYLTEGASREVKIGNQTITLKHVAPSKMLGAGTEAGIVLQAVRSYGQKRVHEIPVEVLAGKLPRAVKSAVRRLAVGAPAWTQPVLRQITA
jgi:hypothetical protein